MRKREILIPLQILLKLLGAHLYISLWDIFSSFFFLSFLPTFFIKPVLLNKGITPVFSCITCSRPRLICLHCFHFSLFQYEFSTNTDSCSVSQCWLTCCDGVNINIRPTLSSLPRRIGNLIIPDCQHATVCCFLTAIRLPHSLATSLVEKNEHSSSNSSKSFWHSGMKVKCFSEEGQLIGGGTHSPGTGHKETHTDETFMLIGSMLIC